MNKKIKVAVILVAIILIATLAISVAYSRYFTKLEGTSIATVAKWSFEATADGKDFTSDTVDLAATRTDSNANVKTGTIAPGTEGAFAIDIDATGTEVSLDYKIELTGTNLPTNLKFYEDSAHTQIVTGLTIPEMTGTINHADADKTKTVTLYWAWDYQTGADDIEIATNDTADTINGETTTNAQIGIKITGTQKQ